MTRGRDRPHPYFELVGQVAEHECGDANVEIRVIPLSEGEFLAPRDTEVSPGACLTWRGSRYEVEKVEASQLGLVLQLSVHQ